MKISPPIRLPSTPQSGSDLVIVTVQALIDKIKSGKTGEVHMLLINPNSNSNPHVCYLYPYNPSPHCE